jgi:Ni,Fe-hydrogenase III component G
MVMIGNMDTFMNARNPKGKELWTRLFNDLHHEKHIYEGLPIKCEKHPDSRTLILSQPEQFDDACPDGGCIEPW